MSVSIGVLCPSEIAFRRFMPAVLKHEGFRYIGVAHASEAEWFGTNIPKKAAQVMAGEKSRAQGFGETYGGQIFNSYSAIIHSPEIEAVYIPLPPALHFKWAKLAIEAGKHVFVEKPSTTRLEDSKRLVALADAKGLALHENYMFVYHRQIAHVLNKILSGVLGEVRLYRILFGFPFRGKQDFRYNKELGGGAILDCGGYTVKLATLLLGNEGIRVCDKHLTISDEFGVDLYGNATLHNSQGIRAQIAFGMDNSYKCELEAWGSKGYLRADRIFTAPPTVSPTVAITVDGQTSVEEVEADDQFYHSIESFLSCIQKEEHRKATYNSIVLQSGLVEDIFVTKEG